MLYRTVHELKMMILATVASGGHQHHKANLLRSSGEVERRYRTTFSDDERQMAWKAFDELRSSDHLRPTLSDLHSPEDWVTITEKGRRSLSTQHLDALDEALAAVDERLPVLREGAWSAFNAGSAHHLEQAANSAVELIDQTLRIAAPDDAVERQEWFNHKKVTRRDRMKYISSQRHQGLGSKQIERMDREFDLLVAIHAELEDTKHSRGGVDAASVRSTILSAERCLLDLLG